jgi:iron complex transport system substrate-binding protein
VGLPNAWSSIKGLKFDPAYGLGETDVEGLTKLGDDTAFWYIANKQDGGDPYTSSLKKNRIWTSLPFVEEGAVHRLPDGIWMFGGPDSMMQLLDAVQAAVKA